MADTDDGSMSYGLTLTQFRKRNTKPTIEMSLQGETPNRGVAWALEMIPAIRLDEASRR